MLDSPEITERTIDVRILEYKPSGMLLAESDDLRGLMIAAASIDQIAEELPSAVRELLEAKGEYVVSVWTVRPKGLPEGLTQYSLKARVKLIDPPPA